MNSARHRSRLRRSVLMWCPALLLLWAVAAVAATAPAPGTQWSILLRPGQPMPGESPHLSISARFDSRLEITADVAGVAALRAAGYTVVARAAEAREVAGYPSYDAIVAQLDAWQTEHPDLCRLYSIGTSIQGRPLWVLKLSDQPDLREPFEPEFRCIATIHGDEAISTALAMRFAGELLESYGQDPFATRLIGDGELHLLPIMNPDGYDAVSRYNAAGVDLNRNFPVPYVRTDAWKDTPVQPETEAVIEWTAAHGFVLSTSWHGGAVGVIYPWGHDHDWTDPAVRFPETPLIRGFCRQFTVDNPYMYQVNSGNWEHGTINGRAWYAVQGEMADWCYRYNGCLETTVEFSNDKAPPFSQTDTYWDSATRRNRQAILNYFALAHGGVRGRAFDAGRSQFVSVTVRPGFQETAALVCVTPALQRGWSFVSLPLTPRHNSLSEVFPDASSAWEFSGDSQRYRPCEQLYAGVGYWIWSEQGTSARRALAGSLAPPTVLRPGWNLVGPLWDVPVSVALAGLSATVYGWTPTAGQAQYQLLSGDDLLVAGVAYWVWLPTTADPRYLGELPDTPYPDNLPVPTGSAPETDCFTRLLSAGNQGLVLQPATPGGLTHTPPTEFLAGETITLEAQSNPPYPSVQVLVLDVPEDTDSIGFPRHLQVAVPMDAAAVESRVLWRSDGSLPWQSSPLLPDGTAGGVAAELPAQPAGTQMQYYMEMRLVGDGTLVDRKPDAGVFRVAAGPQRSGGSSTDSAGSAAHTIRAGRALSAIYGHTAGAAGE